MNCLLGQRTNDARKKDKRNVRDVGCDSIKLTKNEMKKFKRHVHLTVHPHSVFCCY